MPKDNLRTTIRQEINQALERFSAKYLAPAFAHIQDQLNQTATKADLRQFPVRQEVKQAFDQVSQILNHHSQDLHILKSDMSEVKRHLSDLERDVPSQEEFNRLKARIDHYHPIN